ncbi:hypothetical protein FACS1894152_7160 [Bacilli bacterium]|nr:hypothetical protein FACS1894152_7160 [Bacilli bacterium]
MLNKSNVRGVCLLVDVLCINGVLSFGLVTSARGNETKKGFFADMMEKYAFGQYWTSERRTDLAMDMVKMMKEELGKTEKEIKNAKSESNAKFLMAKKEKQEKGLEYLQGIFVEYTIMDIMEQEEKIKEIEKEMEAIKPGLREPLIKKRAKEEKILNEIKSQLKKVLKEETAEMMNVRAELLEGRTIKIREIMKEMEEEEKEKMGIPKVENDNKNTEKPAIEAEAETETEAEEKENRRKEVAKKRQDRINSHNTLISATIFNNSRDLFIRGAGNNLDNTDGANFMVINHDRTNYGKFNARTNIYGLNAGYRADYKLLGNKGSTNILSGLFGLNKVGASFSGENSDSKIDTLAISIGLHDRCNINGNFYVDGIIYYGFNRHWDKLELNDSNGEEIIKQIYNSRDIGLVAGPGYRYRINAIALNLSLHLGYLNSEIAQHDNLNSKTLDSLFLIYALNTNISFNVLKTGLSLRFNQFLENSEAKGKNNFEVGISVANYKVKGLKIGIRYKIGSKYSDIGFSIGCDF